MTQLTIENTKVLVAEIDQAMKDLRSFVPDEKSIGFRQTWRELERLQLQLFRDLLDINRSTDVLTAFEDWRRRIAYTRQAWGIQSVDERRKSKASFLSLAVNNR